MVKYKTPGSMVLVGSMSGMTANKGFNSSIYNGSKAGVMGICRVLAMEVSIVPNNLNDRKHNPLLTISSGPRSSMASPSALMTSAPATS